MPTAAHRVLGSRWFTAGSAAVCGLVLLLASWVGGHPGPGFAMLGVMVGFGAVVMMAGRRSETVQGLLDHRDERITTFDLRATAVMGLVVVTATIVGFVVSLAHGHDGSPYTQLAAIGGLTYLVALIWQRWRG